MWNLKTIYFPQGKLPLGKTLKLENVENCAGKLVQKKILQEYLRIFLLELSVCLNQSGAKMFMIFMHPYFLTPVSTEHKIARLVLLTKRERTRNEGRNTKL